MAILDESLYCYYPNGIIWKINNINSHGAWLFSYLIKKNSVMRPQHLLDFTDKKDQYTIYLPDGNELKPIDNSLGIINLEGAALWSKGGKTYDFNFERGSLEPYGRVINGYSVKIPEGMKVATVLPSIDSVRVEFTNGGHITYLEKYAITGRIRSFNLRYDNCLIEAFAAPGYSGYRANIYFERDGKEYAIDGCIKKLPWTKPENPVRLCEGTLLNSNGQRIDYIENGYTKTERAERATAKRTRNLAQEKRAIAAMTSKWGKWGEVAARGKVAVGMPLALVKKTFVYRDDHNSIYGNGYTIAKSSKRVTDTEISYSGASGIKYAFILVDSNGNVKYVHFYENVLDELDKITY